MPTKTAPAPLPPTPDSALLEAARTGSVEALGALFETARMQLLAVATRDLPISLKGKVGASDIVQQTALDAHRGIPHFVGRTPAEFFGWLRSILETNIADAVRHYERARKRAIAREVSLDDPAQRPLVSLSPPMARRPDDSAVRREEMLAVERALDELTPDRRAVVWMRHWEGRSFADIAERIGSSEAAARKLWYRGVRQLDVVIHAMPAFAGEPRGSTRPDVR